MKQQLEYRIEKRAYYDDWGKPEFTRFYIKYKTRFLGLIPIWRTVRTKTCDSQLDSYWSYMSFNSLAEARIYIEQVLKPDLTRNQWKTDSVESGIIKSDWA